MKFKNALAIALLLGVVAPVAAAGPSVAKKTPGASPTAPVASPKAPGVSPKAPGASPKAPGASPKAPVTSPKAPVASPKASVTPKKAPVVVAPAWMSPDVGAAWSQGYRGQGVTVTVVDDFRSSQTYSGNLGDGSSYQTHGGWTLKEVSMLAPLASTRAHEYAPGTAVALNPTGLNVVSLSYGIMAPASYRADQIAWSAQERSLLGYAQSGLAVVVKSAGNDGVAIGGTTAADKKDYLASALVGAPSAILVGALNTNGTPAARATMAGYSNVAGSDPAVQKQFLVVGVEGHKTGLYGTSFAAPVVSGYSAILGSKFTKATATQVANQLLSTARQDTIAGYNPAIHGRGEASLSRALAPRAIQ